MQAKTINVAVIDDEQEITTMIEKFLMRSGGFRVRTYNNPEMALNRLERDTDVVLLDIMMPQMNGLDLLPRIKERFPDTEVVIMTAYSTLDRVLKAHRKGATHYVMKPFESLEKLKAKIVEVAAG